LTSATGTCNQCGVNDHLTRPEEPGKAKPVFLITIDTEGDDLWSRPRAIRTENSRFLPRFQALCESFGLKPTYLTNHEMALCPVFREFGREALRKGSAEIGMHLHAWNSPPLVPLTDDDDRHQPYLIDFPVELIRAKIAAITDLLEETFDTPMRSHRAGRWAMDARYVRALAERGYTVDCSVTPHFDWRKQPGAPLGGGGSDYRRFPELPYFIDPDDISRPGSSPLLEVPVTIMLNDSVPGRLLRALAGEQTLARRLFKPLCPTSSWLRPQRGNLRAMVNLLRRALREQRPCVEFILHSSELMPGANPAFRTPGDIERLYRDMGILFAAAGEHFRGATLQEFAVEFSSRRMAHSGQS